MPRGVDARRGRTGSSTSPASRTSGAANGNPSAALAVNFGGTRRVLEACAAAAPRCRVLLVSSAEVYGRVTADRLPLTEEQPLRPATAYAPEQGLRGAGRPARPPRTASAVVVARPFNHIGPGQTDGLRGLGLRAPDWRASRPESRSRC